MVKNYGILMINVVENILLITGSFNIKHFEFVMYFILKLV